MKSEEKHPTHRSQKRQRGYLEATCYGCDRIKPVTNGKFYGKDSRFICGVCTGQQEEMKGTLLNSLLRFRP